MTTTAIYQPRVIPPPTALLPSPIVISEAKYQINLLFEAHLPTRDYLRYKWHHVQYLCCWATFPMAFQSLHYQFLHRKTKYLFAFAPFSYYYHDIAYQNITNGIYAEDFVEDGMKQSITRYSELSRGLGFVPILGFYASLKIMARFLVFSQYNPLTSTRTVLPERYYLYTRLKWFRRKFKFSRMEKRLSFHTFLAALSYIHFQRTVIEDAEFFQSLLPRFRFDEKLTPYIPPRD